jgi:4-amino-4-deoxy-L-arabinose transferase-like glycosyltransferase
MQVLDEIELRPALAAPPAPGLPRRPGTVALLVLACLLPRAVAAWQWDVLWGDTLHYIHASVALERGDFKNGFAEFGLNIYPLMLIPLRHLGVDWQIAGKWFSVLAATLAVVPLWGWLRRMFDDRTALLACLVYALHGKLIAISPLIIRDSTFWLLLATTLYCLWRAVNELRFSYYLAAGAGLTLAVYTRTEGWLLLIPLLGWTASRWRAWAAKRTVPFLLGQKSGQSSRARLAAGAIACLAVLPASLAIVNATWLREQPRWEILRENHWQIVLDWWRVPDAAKAASPHALDQPSPTSSVGQVANLPGRLATCPTSNTVPNPRTNQTGEPQIPPPSHSIILPPVSPPEKSAPLWLLTFKLLERAAKGFTWVGSLLLLFGISAHWRTFLRPEHLALLAMNLLLLVVSGIRYRSAGLDLRYFMPMVIVGLPWMALGAQYLVTAALGLLRRRGRLSFAMQRALVCGSAAILIVCSLLDAPLSAAAHMRRHAALGRWIRDHSGTAPTLAGNIDIDDMSLDTFYSQGKFVGTVGPRECLMVPPPDIVARRAADFLVLWNSEDMKREQLALIEQRIAGYGGYRRVPPPVLPAGENAVMLFERR